MSDVREVNVQVCKCTLSTKKVVMLRLPLIGDTEEAARIAGAIADSKNQAHLGMLLQKELVKRLLVQVDEQELKLNDKQDLNKLFTYGEYSEVMKVVQELTGSDEDTEAGKKPVMEFVPFGSK